MPDNADECPHCGKALPDTDGEYFDSVEFCQTDGRDYHEDCMDEVGFKCGGCDEWFLDSGLSHIAVIEAQPEVKRGVYRIIKTPFHGGSIIGRDALFPDALCRDGHLLGDEPTDWPVCLLCQGCATERGAKGIKKESVHAER